MRKRNTEDKLKLLDDAAGELKDAFDAVSRQALDKNSESFVVFARSVFERYQQSARTICKSVRKESPMSSAR